MKKTLLIAALTMVSATATASSARRAALDAVNGSGFSTTVTNQFGVTGVGSVTPADDVQGVFTNPAKMFSFGDLFTAEFGAAPSGGVFRAAGDTKFGVYLNHKTPMMSLLTAAMPAATATPLTEANPFEIFYGSKAGMKWGASLNYSETKNNVAAGIQGTKTSTAGLRFGASTDLWEAYAGLGLIGKADVFNGNSGQVDMGIQLGGQYNLPNMAVYLDLQSGNGKYTVGTTDSKVSAQLITLGVESKVKAEAAHFFYGVRYVSYNQKVGDTKSASNGKLPLYAGIEFDAASWMTLRASLSQSVLLNSAKTENPPATTDTTNAADTIAAFGAGFKWGKAIVDGTLVAGGTGNFGFESANFLTNLSLTYNF